MKKIKLDSFERERELEREFDYLDDDEDGHVEFEKLEFKYLAPCSPAQRSFLYQVEKIIILVAATGGNSSSLKC